LRVGSIRAPRAWLWFVLWLLLMVPTSIQIYHRATYHYSPPRGTMIYYDLSAFLGQVRDYEKTGRLYAVDQADFYDPGSRVYKYPATFAAILRPMAKDRLRPIVRKLLPVNFALLLLTLGVLLVYLKPPPVRAMFMILTFLNWQPFWESLGGMQLEPAMLLLLSVSAVLLGREGGRENPGARSLAFWAGVPLGLAGALKVYPFGLALYFVVRRKWWVLPGIAAGFAAALIHTSLTFSFGVNVEYFTRILPRLGGTSLNWENVSLLGSLGRLVLLLFGGPAALNQAVTGPYEMLETVKPALVRPTALALAGIGALSLAWLTAKRARRVEAASMEAPEVSGAGHETVDVRGLREMSWFGAAICLYLFLMPTSWVDYQTLLALPTLVAFSGLPAWPRAKGSWGLVVAVAFSAVFGSYTRLVEEHHFLIAVWRTWMPLALWWVLLRPGPGGCGRGSRGSLPGGRSPARVVEVAE